MLKIFGNIYKNTLLRNSYNFGILKFNLPDLGQKIKEGTIKKLYVKQGDRVEEFQKLADVASDKQFTQITASDRGVIKKIHCFEQQICQVGGLFLQIEIEDDKSQPVQVQTKVESSIKQNIQSSSNTQKKSETTNTEVLATPFIRGLIKKHNLTIQEIQGTGEGGRILEQDIMAIVNGLKPKRVPSIQFGKKTEQPQVKIDQPKITPSQPPKKVTPPPSSSPSISRQSTSWNQTSQVQKMSNFEKGMQKSMTVANSIPHLYFHQEYDLTQAEKMRKSFKTSNLPKKVTVMGILIKTFSLALKKYPKMNSTYFPEKNEFQYNMNNFHNISIAIDSPNGLVVPNIKNVQNLSLVQIQSEMQKLKNLSSEGRLTSNELNNGTICLSNIGTIGGVMTNPLILAPQVCIVGIGKLQTVPKFKGSEVVARTIINVSFGCDHRIVDGATVARFSSQWKTLLQNPYLAFAQMI